MEYIKPEMEVLYLNNLVEVITTSVEPGLIPGEAGGDEWGDFSQFL